MQKKRLIIDLSSILWTCLLAGKDAEFGKIVDFDGKKVQVNSAAYGYENAINHFVSVFAATDTAPIDMLLVVEGMHSKSLRTTMLANYKGGGKATRPPEAYEEFTKLKDKLLDTFLALGASAVSQDGIEGDDVIGYLALNLSGEKIIDTGDGDMAVLISDGTTGTENVKLYRGGRIVEENPLGPFPCRYITLYKALVGDTSDKIPGANGFGKTAWMDMLCTFGYEGLEAFHQLFLTKTLNKLEEDVADFKPLQRVLDNIATVYASFNCARLYPDRVNRQRTPLQWTVGMVKPRSADTDERLKQFAGAVRLVHAGNFKEAVSFFKDKLSESPFVAFDIETSSTDTGEEWLINTKKKEMEEGDDIGVDAFGAELAGFGITFGRNNQFTFYFTVDHLEEKGTKNITKAQAKEVIEAIPLSMVKAVHNVGFELPVVKENLGDLECAA